MYKYILVFILSVLSVGCGGSGDSKVSNINDEPPLAVSKEPLPVVPLENKIEEIATFIQLAYQVRYFHPSDGATQTLWEKFISYGIYKVATTNNHDEFVTTLRELFSNIAPNLKINGQSFVNVESPKENDQVRVWQNKGYKDQYELGQSIYSRKIVTDSFSELKKLSYIDTVSYKDILPLSIEIELPVVLTVKDEKTVPESMVINGEFESYDISVSFTELYARLTAAGQLWAVLQHFYPYMEELDLVWSDELPSLVGNCIDSTSSCGLAMRQLLAKTGDNHNYITSIHTTLGEYTTPIGFAWLDEKVQVLYKETDDIGVSIGDELVAIDGVNIDSIFADKLKYSHRAENRKFQLLASFDLLRGEENQTVELTIKSSTGEEYQLTTHKTARATDIYNAIRNKITFANNNKLVQLNHDIYYVNLDLLEGSDVESTVEQLKDAKAVILDLRNYPNWDGWRGLLSHFIDQSINSLPMFEGLYFYPNQYEPFIWQIDQKITNTTPFFDIPIIALASSYSISQNEHALGYVQDADIPILGEPTYGINGNISYIHLLGGMDREGVTIVYTGMKVTQHDGSLLRGVGIQPDISVPITIDSIKKDEDIQLQAAIDYLQLQL